MLNWLQKVGKVVIDDIVVIAGMGLLIWEEWNILLPPQGEGSIMPFLDFVSLVLFGGFCSNLD